MIITCKNCGVDVGNDIVQVWINELILSGKKYINSDGTEAKYQEVKNQCDKCNHKINTYTNR